MLTNIIKYEPKTDWENNRKVDMNIRDLQEKYPNGCNCCGKFYSRSDFSRMVASHFKTQKHKNKCLYISNEKFISDFRDVTDINRDFEEKCKENRYLKQALYEQRQRIKELENELAKFYVPRCTNLIDI